MGKLYASTTSNTTLFYYNLFHIESVHTGKDKEVISLP